MSRSKLPGFLAAGLLLALLPAAYMGAFYLRGEMSLRVNESRLHLFPTEFEAIVFLPAAKLESIILGKTVWTTGPSYRWREV